MGSENRARIGEMQSRHALWSPLIHLERTGCKLNTKKRPERLSGGDPRRGGDRSMTAIACMRKAISPNRVGLTTLRERYAIHETRNSTPRIANTIEMLQRQKVPESVTTYCG